MTAAADPFRLPTGGDPHVDMIGHATLAIRHGGRTLLTDPWLLDPMGRSSEYHFPLLVHDPASVAAATDAIYISHIHPDHFHRPTLELFSKDTPVYIGHHRSDRFRDAVAALGFEVIEIPFQQPAAVHGTDMSIVILEHDYDENAAFDSSLVVRTPSFTLFENNDCYLQADKYRWVRERFSVDYAFLGYSAASFFPICFEMEDAEKQRLLQEAADRRYGDCVQAARLLQPKVAVPFANGARFFLESSLWRNVSFSSGVEAARRLEAGGITADVMGPGDSVLADGSIRHVAPVLDKAAELAAVAEHARSVQHGVVAHRSPAPQVQPDLVERFRVYMLDLWRRNRRRMPGVAGSVIAYVVTGELERSFHFDFSRDGAEIFGHDVPERYDMRYTYPARALQMRMDGLIDWDELHFSEDVSVHQRRYARDFYRMLRSETLGLE